MKILNSATRIALLLVIGSLSVLTTYVVVKNVSDQTVIAAITGLFSTTVVAITSFYFGQKTATAEASKQDVSAGNDNAN